MVRILAIVILVLVVVIALVWAFAPNRRSSAELPTHPVCNPNQPEKLALVMEVDPSTVWQPRGGEIKFSLKGTKDAGFSAIDVNIAACFLWYSADGTAAWYRSPSVRLLSSTNDQSTPSATYAATVPSDLPDAESWCARILGKARGTSTGLFASVPVAKFRVLASGPATAKWSPAGAIFDTGVTSLGFAFLLAAAAVVVAGFVLHWFGKSCGVPGNSVMLRIISTRRGYASLSQLQIVLWSFVIGAGAVYVMSLSGNLINITQGTLILLGITGAATVGSKLQSHQESQPTGASTPTSPPRELTVNGSPGRGYVRLLWAAPVNGKANCYIVQYKKGTAADWSIGSSTVTERRFTVVGLELEIVGLNSATYNFRVLAVNEGGASDPSNVVSADVPPDDVLPDTPRQVPNFSVISAMPATREVKLSWERPPTATDYIVQYRRHDSDELWQQIGNPVPDANFPGLFTVPPEKLDPNTPYDFHVAARNNNGRGPWSPIARAIPGGRVPRWADLVIPDDHKREIDVTRVQMLFFTVISAAFVAMKVLVSSVIPEIPDGFLLLMGISNGVYLTAKFVPD